MLSPAGWADGLDSLASAGVVAPSESSQDISRLPMHSSTVSRSSHVPEKALPEGSLSASTSGSRDVDSMADRPKPSASPDSDLASEALDACSTSSALASEALDTCSTLVASSAGGGPAIQSEPACESTRK